MIISKFVKRRIKGEELSTTQSNPVALFIPTLRGGGAERVMIMVANGLTKDGISVDLITGNAAGPYESLLHKDVNLVDFRSSRLLTSVPKLLRYLKRTKPRALLASSEHASIVSVLLRKFVTPETSLVVSVHNSHSTAENLGLKDSLIAFLCGITFPLADGVVAVSEGIREQLIQKLSLVPENVHTVYNPLDNELISQQLVGETGHPWLDSPDRPVIIGLGCFVHHKNFDLLIRAFHQVRLETKCRLIILGDGEERPDLEKLIKDLKLEDDVDLPGFQSNPFPWLHRSDLFVLSSRSEGLPGVLLESLACGTEVVATECVSGVSEILEDGRWGTLVPSEDMAKMSEAILQSLHTPKRTNLYERALAFDVPIATRNYRKLLLGD